MAPTSKKDGESKKKESKKSKKETKKQTSKKSTKFTKPGPSKDKKKIDDELDQHREYSKNKDLKKIRPKMGNPRVDPTLQEANMTEAKKSLKKKFTKEGELQSVKKD